MPKGYNKKPRRGGRLKNENIPKWVYSQITKQEINTQQYKNNNISSIIVIVCMIVVVFIQIYQLIK